MIHQLNNAAQCHDRIGLLVIQIHVLNTELTKYTSSIG